MSKQWQKQWEEQEINKKTVENGKTIELIFDIYLEDFPTCFLFQNGFKSMYEGDPRIPIHVTTQYFITF